MHMPPWPNCGGEHLYSYKSTCVYTCSYTIQMKYMLVATLTEYCSCDVYTGLLEPIRHSNIAPMGLSNEAGLLVDCGAVFLSEITMRLLTLCNEPLLYLRTPKSATKIKCVSLAMLFPLQSLPSQARLFKSLKLWSYYVDLEESIGTVETTK